MKRMLRILSVSLLVLVLVTTSAMAKEQSPNYNPPVVQVQGGLLRGLMDGDTYNFRGVQYATAERWQQPQPVAPWEGIKNAQSYGAIAPIAKQRLAYEDLGWPHRYWIQDEQCMNLNIWTPSIDPEAKKPVIVFFHGGGFSNGSSIEAYAYDGKNLSEFGDVVTVTVNHRLNVLGCLDLSAYGEEYKNSANVGMADLVAALEWVQENIEVFGGDPERVMIFGQSGGSTKTVLMYYMPAAEGLFTSGIGMSAGGVMEMVQGDSARAAEIILEKFELDGTQIDQLKEVPYDDLIVAATEALAQVSQETGRSVSWFPTVDGEYIQTEWTEYAKNIPYMLGSVFAEFSGFGAGNSGKNEWSAEEIETRLTAAFGDKKDAIVKEFANLFPDKPVQDVLYYNKDRYGGRFGMAEIPPEMVKQSNAPVYHYLFTYEIPINGGIPANHCCDLTFVFHNVGLPECTISTGGTPAGYALQDVMAQAWVNFAATGDPNQESLAWAPWTEDQKQSMIFDIESKCVPFDDAALCELLAN